MATRLNPSTFGYQNFYSALLTADITAGTLTISLDTVPSPTAGILVIDPDSTTGREVILYTSKGASTVTCPSDGRGYSGTSAASHLQGTTVIMAPVDKWFTALASGELSSDPLRTELFFDYVASGCVWSGDSYGSNRNASMTSGVIYIQGRRLTMSAVTARSFTASKDTYIDVADSAGDGTGTIAYTEVSNNAASPALSTNNVRIGIIVTGASSIANAGSVNQGEPDKVLPIASSLPYATTDSLGNLICPRDPNRRVLGYRQMVSNYTTTSSTSSNPTGLTVPVIVPTGRRIKVTAHARHTNATNGNGTGWYLNDGAIGGGSIIADKSIDAPDANYKTVLHVEAVVTPTSSSKTYAVGTSSGNNVALVTIHGSSTNPAWILVELL